MGKPKTKSQGVVTPIGTVVLAKTGVKKWSTARSRGILAIGQAVKDHFYQPSFCSYYITARVAQCRLRFLVPGTQTGWQFSGGLTFTFHWSELQI